MLLVTGFEPFEGLARNPSGDAARAIAGPGVEGVVLPVDYEAVERRLDELLARDWSAVLMLGVDAGGSSLRVERVAINHRDPLRPDNSGRCPEGVTLVERGPAAYFATMRPESLQSRLAEAGFRARISLSAGDYLCNASFYLALAGVRRRGIPCGFVHVPPTPDLETKGEPMEFEELVRAVRVMVDCARQAGDTASIS